MKEFSEKNDNSSFIPRFVASKISNFKFLRTENEKSQRC